MVHWRRVCVLTIGICVGQPEAGLTEVDGVVREGECCVVSGWSIPAHLY